jgi:hypothetical protein
MPFWRRAAMMPTEKMVFPDPPRNAAMTMPGVSWSSFSMSGCFKNLKTETNKKQLRI